MKSWVKIISGLAVVILAILAVTSPVEAITINNKGLSDTTLTEADFNSQIDKSGQEYYDAKIDSDRRFEIATDILDLRAERGKRWPDKYPADNASNIAFLRQQVAETKDRVAIADSTLTNLGASLKIEGWNPLAWGWEGALSDAQKEFTKKSQVTALGGVLGIDKNSATAQAFATSHRNTDKKLGVEAAKARALECSLTHFDMETCLLTAGVAMSRWAAETSGLLLVAPANSIFNYSIDISIRQFNDIASSPAVKNAWAIIRDLVNILLIFLLLWAAIGLILQLENVDTRRLIIYVIITGLLINFSFFLVNYFITGCNILANQFYSFAAGVPLDQIDTTPDIGGQFSNMVASLAADMSGKPVSLALMIAYFSQFFLSLITIVVLVAGALMMIVRLIKLLLVLIFSPAALLLPVTPIAYAKKLGGKWNDTLFQQALFAPIYLFLIAISIRIAIKGNAFVSLHSTTPDFTQLTSPSIAPALIYAALINGLMIASLLVAQTLSAYGAGGAIGFLKGAGNRTRGWLGRNTAGRGASWLNREFDNTGRKMGESLLGRMGLRTLRKFGGGTIKDTIKYAAEEKKFGGTKSFKQVQEEWKGRVDKNLESHKKDLEGMARAIGSYSNQPLGSEQANYAWGKLTPQQRAEIKAKKWLKESAVIKLDKKLTEDNQKKANSEQKELAKAEREASEQINVTSFTNAVKKLKEAESDSAKETAQKEMLEVASKLTNGQVKNDITIEDLMTVAEKGGWKGSQLDAVIKKDGGRSDLTPDNAAKLGAMKIEVENKTRRQKIAREKLEEILRNDNSDSVGTEVASIISNLQTQGQPANLPLSRNAIMKLDWKLMSDLAAQKLISLDQQSEIRSKFLEVVINNDAATQNQRETRDWLTKHPIGQAFGKKT